MQVGSAVARGPDAATKAILCAVCTRKGILEANPDTKFVLFHGGYPWIGETGAIAMKHRNVWIAVLAESPIRLTGTIVPATHLPVGVNHR